MSKYRKKASLSTKTRERAPLLTLEEESAQLLGGGRRHSEPHGGVGPHGLCP